MKKVTFKGTVNNAEGCAVLFIINRGETVIYSENYYSSFTLTLDLDANNYDAVISGITQGKFTFDITGAAYNISPNVPENYTATVTGGFNFDV